MGATLLALRGGGLVRVLARRPSAVPAGGGRPREAGLSAGHGDRGSGLGLGFGGEVGIPSNRARSDSGTTRACG